LKQKLQNQELELARERVRIQEEQMKISENLVEDEKKLADFRADVLAKETKSLRLQKRVKTEINELNREIEAEEEAARKLKKNKKKKLQFEKRKKQQMEKAAKEAEKLAKKKAKEILDIAKATEEAKLRSNRTRF
jgi:hypothetical protein